MYSYVTENLGVPITWLIILSPIIIAFFTASNTSKELKANPYRYFFNKIRKKYIKKKIKRSFLGLFMMDVFMIYYIIAGLFATLVAIFFSWIIGMNYLSANFQSYPWKFFGAMYNFFGVIFLTYISCFLNYIFWLGLLPNTIDKITNMFKKSKKIK